MQYFSEFSGLETESALLKQNRIGILGGTFNPVHNGHLAIANIALYEFLLGEVVFLPLGTPPHKKDEYIAPPEHRLEMVKLAIQGEPRFSVSTLEIFREGYTYTVDTLEILARENKNAEYYYIIGADTIFELKTWKNYERVFCLANFICVLRPGQDDKRVRAYADALNETYGYKFFVAQEKGPDISSSFIREMAATRRLNGLVPDSVARYIEMNRVYVNTDQNE